MRNSASSQRGSVTRLPGLPAADQALQNDLMKLRAVLILLGARRGSKVSAARNLTAALKTRGLKVSIRSVYHWRDRYLCFGFAGIARKRRNDSGYPRQLGEDLVGIVDAAARIRRQGDIRREFRRLKPTVCYETFRTWVRRVQAGLRITEVPERGGTYGLVL